MQFGRGRKPLIRWLCILMPRHRARIRRLSLQPKQIAHQSWPRRKDRGRKSVLVQAQSTSQTPGPTSRFGSTVARQVWWW